MAVPAAEAAAGVGTVDVGGLRVATEMAVRYPLGLEAEVLDRQITGRGRGCEQDGFQIAGPFFFADCCTEMGTAVVEW